MKRQYQGKAEVLTTAGERITPDKWWRPVSQPIFKPFVVAVIASFFFVPVPIVRAESWERRQSEPVRRIETRYTNPSFFHYPGKEALEAEQTVDRWMFKIDNPVLPRHREFQFPSVFYNPKDYPPSMDWRVESEIPVRSVSKLHLWPSVFFNPKDYPPPMDWFVQAVDRFPKQPFYFLRDGAFVDITSLVEIVTMDKWFSECMFFNPILRILKDYAYLYYQRCVLVIPIPAHTNVVSVNDVRNVVRVAMQRGVIEKNLNPDRFRVDNHPGVINVRPPVDPTIQGV